MENVLKVVSAAEKRDAEQPEAMASKSGSSAIQQQKQNYNSAVHCLSAISDYVAAEQADAKRQNERQQALSEKLAAMSKELSSTDYSRLQEKLLRLANEPAQENASVIFDDLMHTLNGPAPKSKRRKHFFLVSLFILGVLAVADWQISLGSPAYLESKNALLAQGSDFIKSVSQNIFGRIPQIKQ